jgi:hypothetical protein
LFGSKATTLSGVAVISVGPLLLVSRKMTATVAATTKVAAVAATGGRRKAPRMAT